MGAAFFLYTVALICVANAACFLSIAIWVMTSRRDCLASFAGFLLYALNLARILFDEYTREKVASEGMFDLPLLHPVATTLLYGGIIICIWLWVCLRAGDSITFARPAVLFAAFVLVELLLVPRQGHAGALRQFTYWLVIALVELASLGYAAMRYRTCQHQGRKEDMARSAWFFRLAVALVVAMVIEDALMILVIRPDYSHDAISQFFWYLSERSFSENVLMIACAIELIRRNQRILQIYSTSQLAGRSTLAEDLSITEDEVRSRALLFAEEHGLSDREREVFVLAMLGSDAQNIASELFISSSTVKTHLSHIYQKAGVANRAELTNAFWSLS